MTSFNLDSLGSPTATSSPMQKTRSNTYTKKPRSDTPLRILVVNCQSIKNKKQEEVAVGLPKLSRLKDVSVNVSLLFTLM
jgi:hypothetical protein